MRGAPVVEIAPAAAGGLDSRATERLVALETGDILVPRPRGASSAPPLYFRVLAAPPGSLRVELWELGRPYGARHVAASGGSQLRARRIALAAAELVKGLRKRRTEELARPEGAAPDHGAGGRSPGFTLHGRLVGHAGTHAATLGGDDAWLVGPGGGLGVELDPGTRVELGAAWLAGSAPRFGGASLRWLEVRVGIGQRFRLSEALSLVPALEGAAASVRLGEVGPPDGVREPVDTWSARAGLGARLEIALGGPLALGVGPDLGFVLHAVGPGVEPQGIGGAWLGGALTLRIDTSRGR